MSWKAGLPKKWTKVKDFGIIKLQKTSPLHNPLRWGCFFIPNRLFDLGLLFHSLEVCDSAIETACFMKRENKRTDVVVRLVLGVKPLLDAQVLHQFAIHIKSRVTVGALDADMLRSSRFALMAEGV